MVNIENLYRVKDPDETLADYFYRLTVYKMCKDSHEVPINMLLNPFFKRRVLDENLSGYLNELEMKVPNVGKRHLTSDGQAVAHVMRRINLCFPSTKKHRDFTPLLPNSIT